MEQEAREKMEEDLYIEIMEDKGISQKQRINQSLDEYAKLDQGR